MKINENRVTLVYDLANNEVYTKQVKTTAVFYKVVIAVVALLVLSLIIAIGIQCS